MSGYTQAVRQAIAKYGERACSEAYVLNTTHGEGAESVAIAYAIPGINSTRQAESAINAGRALAKAAAAIAKSTSNTP